MLGSWNTCPVKRCEGSRICAIREEGASGGPSSSPQFLQGGQPEEGAKLLTVVLGGRTQGNRHKLKKERIRLCIRNKLFTV